MADFLEHRGFRGIVGNVDPWRTVLGYRWRLRPLEARYPEPDRSVLVAEVRRYPRKASDLVLMENELRAVHELVLREPGCRPFIEFHERLDIVEQSIESLGGNLVFSRQFWGHDETFSQLQRYEMWKARNRVSLRQCQ